MAVSIRYLLRSDTAENWESLNPILLKGEPGFDLTNNRIKIGNGTTQWADLPFCDVIDHNATSGLQGGQENEYYHLTATELDTFRTIIS